MGTVISNAANGIGNVLGNIFYAPFKTIFGARCEDVCAGPWEVICFIEHLCVSNLVKFLMILGLCYIFFLFFYLLFQLGICQCIGRSLCKMCWGACDTYWHSLEYITCFLWHKLKNTKRVYRRRQRHFGDAEKAYFTSSESDDSNNYHQLSVSRKRKSVREGRNVQLWCSPYPSSRHGNGRQHDRHHQVGLKTRRSSLHVKGGSTKQRNSRQFHLVNVKSHSRDAASFKRRHLK